MTCDVLVAGSGAAGFAAALTARLHGLDVIMVEKEPLFGGTTAFSAGVIWIPRNSHQRAAGVVEQPDDALTYLTSHVGNRLDRAKAEAFIANAPAMLDAFEREDFVSYDLAATWADYHPDEPGGSQGGRSLVPNDYDGRKLGSWFDKLRPALTDHDAARRHDGRPQRSASRFQDDAVGQVRAARGPHGGPPCARPAAL